MGSGEGESSAKAPKTMAVQEQPPTTSPAAAVTVYPDWSNFQAFPPIPPHGFFPSPVASSPQAHPYMWGAQHLMPPYGTPPPPYLMYSPRGLYAHPSIPPGSHPFGPYAVSAPNANADISGPVLGSMEIDSKSAKGKERGRMKRSRGGLSSSNMISGKNNSEPCKESVPPVSEVSGSGDSASDSSSEESYANSENDSQLKTSGGHESFDAPSQAMMSQTTAIVPMPAAAAPGGVVGPTTNLNIGMEYWAPSSLSPIPSVHGTMPATTVGGATVPGAPSGHWLQDERQRKIQRRKQSNREAARRSRLRKQAEFEELANRAETLHEENISLRTELNRIKAQYEHLLSENNSLKEKLGEVQQESQEPEPESKEQPFGKENPK